MRSQLGQSNLRLEEEACRTAMDERLAIGYKTSLPDKIFFKLDTRFTQALFVSYCY